MFHFILSEIDSPWSVNFFSVSCSFFAVALQEDINNCDAILGLKTGWLVGCIAACRVFCAITHNGLSLWSGPPRWPSG